VTIIPLTGEFERVWVKAHIGRQVCNGFKDLRRVSPEMRNVDMGDQLLKGREAAAAAIPQAGVSRRDNRCWWVCQVQCRSICGEC
jgi:hypothetical protein